jgi:L-histidine Nalpha-methyltransferase
MAIYRNETGPMNPDTMGQTTFSNEFERDVVLGLKNSPKRLSPKYFYNERGSELFEKICSTQEYYPTRTEIKILENSIDEISRYLGPDCLLFEFGSGSSTKTRILLDHLQKLAGYLPIDISGEFLLQTAARLRSVYPAIPISPIIADFSKPLDLSKSMARSGGNPEKAGRNSGSSVVLPTARRRTGFLPGSTLGNFAPEDACRFLASTADLLGQDGYLLIGLDLVKEVSILEAAYNDCEGVTSEFNLNVLHRIKEELGASVEVESFSHKAFFNPAESRIEMHLYSRKEQNFEVAGETISFHEGESIHTENSYKYTPERFEMLANNAGFELVKTWTDPQKYFGVFLLKTQIIQNLMVA